MEFGEWEGASEEGYLIVLYRPLSPRPVEPFRIPTPTKYESTCNRRELAIEVWLDRLFIHGHPARFRFRVRGIGWADRDRNRSRETEMVAGSGVLERNWIETETRRMRAGILLALAAGVIGHGDLGSDAYGAAADVGAAGRVTGIGCFVADDRTAVILRGDVVHARDL